MKKHVVDDWLANLEALYVHAPAKRAPAPKPAPRAPVKRAAPAPAPKRTAPAPAYYDDAEYAREMEVRRAGKPAPRSPAASSDVIYFPSGSNHAGEIRGFVEIGYNVGVAIPEVGAAAMQELLGLHGTDVLVFVDSGAFGEVSFNYPKKDGKLPRPDLPLGPFVKKPITDAHWSERLDEYDVLAEGLGSQVYLVAPDKVGFQKETIARLKKYAARVRDLRDAGANIIVAIQGPVTLSDGEVLGAWSLSEMDERASKALGFDDYVRGMPMRAAATKLPDLLAFIEENPHVQRMHLLGMGPSSHAYAITVETVMDARPDMDLSCDSVLLKAHIGKSNAPGGGPRRYTKALAEYWDEARAEEYQEGSYTDNISEVNSWLTKTQRNKLAEEWKLSELDKRLFLKDPETWLQIDDNYLLPWVAGDLDEAYAAWHFKQITSQRKKAGAVLAFGGESGFELSKPTKAEDDEDDELEENPADTFVLVGCCKKKSATQCEAQHLYQSDLFKKSVAYAKRRGLPWGILSAKYGLLLPDDIVEPYELELSKQPMSYQREWASMVRDQLDERVPGAHYIVIAGRPYRAALAGLPHTAPFAGLELGELLSALKHDVGDT